MKILTKGGLFNRKVAEITVGASPYWSGVSLTRFKGCPDVMEDDIKDIYAKLAKQ